MTTTTRTHDAFYLNENRYENAKESFKFLGNLMEKKRDELRALSRSGLRFADWGCANGEFPYHLHKIFPSDEIVGYELLPELLEKARSSVSGVTFHQASILDPDAAPMDSADISSANGILGIFERFEPVLENLLRWTRPGGAVYIDGLFNNFPLDVYVTYNRTLDYGKGILESGWNIFSKASVGRYLQSHPKVLSFKFHDFTIPIDLAPQADPVRSWTEQYPDGSRYITNGLCLIQPESMLEVQLAS